MYGQLFKEADPDGFGAVSGDVAVKFFEKTKLAPDVLGQVIPSDSGLVDAQRLTRSRSGKSQIQKIVAS